MGRPVVLLNRLAVFHFICQVAAAAAAAAKYTFHVLCDVWPELSTQKN